jgi:capsular polysaccharide biosynthesis protein
MVEIQEEIDLREYINVLIKRKGVIILIFLITVITAVIVSYFIMEPVYQANTVITVLKPKIENSIISELSLGDYRNLIKDIEIEEELIQKLNLNKPPLEITPNDLERMLTIESPEDTNLIKMNIQTSNPKLCKDIIDTWTTLFVEKNKTLYFDEVKKVKTDIESKLKLAEQDFFEIEEKTRKFENTSNTELIESEIISKIAEIIKSKLRLIDIGIALEKEKVKKEEITKAVGEQEKVLKLNKSIIGDEFFIRLISKITDDNFDIANLTYISEQTNPIYYSLAQQLISSNITIATLQTEKIQLEKNLDFFSLELKSVKEKLTENKLILSRMYRNYSIKEKAYNNYYKQVEEIGFCAAMEENLLKITSLAYEPKYPIKPNKKLIILFAGVLGLFIGIFVAYFMEFWQKGK